VALAGSVLGNVWYPAFVVWGILLWDVCETIWSLFALVQRLCAELRRIITDRDLLLGGVARSTQGES
jgi:hypothetical protein